MVETLCTTAFFGGILLPEPAAITGCAGTSRTAPCRSDNGRQKEEAMGIQTIRVAALFTAATGMLLSGCMTAAEHQQSLSSAKEREMTVGIVQKEIRAGMSQADVAAALGSPNIVTRDSEGKETWIYDKIATEASYSRDSGGASGIAGAGGLAGSVLILGGLGGSYSKDAGASSTTQKTLTVIIKFNKDTQVETFSYHASRF
jgi:outer membrane protein assembly factor BamE (lipoprotein component of BamABCDE complex)